MKANLPPIEQLRPLVVHYATPHAYPGGQVGTRPLCGQKTISGKAYTRGPRVTDAALVTCKRCLRSLATENSLPVKAFVTHNASR